MSNSSVTPVNGGHSSILRPLLYAVIGGVVVCVAIFAWRSWSEISLASRSDSGISRDFGLGDGAHKKLDLQFTPAAGGYLAALPSDAAKIVDPPLLKLVYVESDAEGAAKISWDALGKQISSQTGKEVSVKPFDATHPELDQIHQGGFQILVVHAAETPYLVNHFGFIPFAVAGDDRGPDGHRLNIIVRSNSDIQTPDQIRGHTLMCTEPLSISGYRAALAYLQQSYGLHAGADYLVTYSGSQTNSIEAIGSGRAEAAAVSNDKLASLTKKGDIAASGYRVIYESEAIPRFAIGYMYNLKPEVAAEIKKAVLSFVSSPATQPGTERVIRFVPIDYAKDFAMIRTMDDAFESRVVSEPKAPEGPAAK